MERAKLQTYQAGTPVACLHVDILGPFPVSSCGNKYILIIIDQFTQWVKAFTVPDQAAETTAICSPRVAHGPGSQFLLFQAECKLLQIMKTRTKYYHPASKGQVERFNTTVLQMNWSFAVGTKSLPSRLSGPRAATSAMA